MSVVTISATFSAVVSSTSCTFFSSKTVPSITWIVDLLSYGCIELLSSLLSLDLVIKDLIVCLSWGICKRDLSWFVCSAMESLLCCWELLEMYRV